MTTNTAENATAGVPVVRGLVWENGKAVSPIGRYSIQRTPDGYAAVWEHEELAHFGFNTDDPFQEAKKTVEADYEQRILSALNPDYASALDTARAEIERLRHWQLEHAKAAQRDLTAAQERISEQQASLEAIELACLSEDDDSAAINATVFDIVTRARATLSPAVKEPK